MSLCWLRKPEPEAVMGGASFVLLRHCAVVIQI